MANTSNTAVDINEPFVEHDSKYPNLRNRAGRRLVLILSAALVYGLPILALLIINHLFLNFPYGIPIGLGIIIGGIPFSKILPRRFLKVVPEGVALLTQFPVGGKLVPYGPGVDVQYPIERATRKSNFSLQVISRTFNLSVPTRTGAATVEGVLQYAGNLEDGKIIRLVRATDVQIDEGFISYIEAFLTPRLAQKSLEDARGNVEGLNHELQKEFIDVVPNRGPKAGLSGRDFLDGFGIKVILLKIQKIQLPAAVQKVQDAEAEAEAFRKVVAKTYNMTTDELTNKIKSGEISLDKYNEMLEYALAASDNATMDIKVYRGDAFKGIGAAGPIIASTLGNDQNGNNQRNPKKGGK